MVDGQKVGKPAANVDEQIETLLSHDVRFELCSTGDARGFLLDRTYFFKLKAFDNKFEKDVSGRYYHLDFAYLQDISTIDYHIRQVVLRLTADIEHAMKVRFNGLLMRKTTENGYSIVRDFKNHQNSVYKKKGNNRSFTFNFRNSPYTGAIIKKYEGNPPAWLIWEVCTLSTTNDFYKFFLEKNKYEDQTYALLDAVRLLRNAASHNNCLLTAPSTKLQETTALTSLLGELLPVGYDQQQRDNVLQLARHDPLIHDLCSTLCSHINLVQSQGIISRTNEMLTALGVRIQRNADWYKSTSNHCIELESQLDALVTLTQAFTDFSREQSRKLDLRLTRLPKVHKTRPQPRHRKRANVQIL